MLAEILIANPEGKLIPGLFGKVTLTARGLAEKPVALVPNPAIQAPRQAAPFVFVVKSEDGKNTVERRVVKLGGTMTPGTFWFMNRTIFADFRGITPARMYTFSWSHSFRTRCIHSSNASRT